MTILAKRLEDWVEDAGEHWAHGNGVVVWALAFGSDAEQAWQRCPRADYLAVLADVGIVQHAALQRGLAAVTKRLVGACREHAGKLRQMQHVAERAAHDGLPADEGIGSDEAMLVFVGKGRAVQRAFDAVRADVESFVHDTRRTAKERTGIVNAPALAPLRAFFDDIAKRTAAMHAVKAFSAGVAVARSIERLNRDTALLDTAEDDPARTDEAVELILGIREASAGSVSFAVSLLHSAARAEGYAAARSDEAWEQCALAVLAPRAEGAPADENILCTLVSALDTWSARRGEQLLAQYADILRTEIPFGSLDFSGEHGDAATAPRGATAPIASMSEARASIRNGLIATLAIVRELGHDQVRDPIEVAIAILNAPGELDRVTLSPVMETVHERLATVFRAEAKAAGPREGKPWLRLASDVDGDRRFFSEWLAQSGGRGN